jgi:hypothetical protein
MMLGARTKKKTDTEISNKNLTDEQPGTLGVARFRDEETASRP